MNRVFRPAALSINLNNAFALCQAVQHPSKRFIPVKPPQQQAMLPVHLMREHWVHVRTALMNHIRSLTSEFCLIIRSDARR